MLSLSLTPTPPTPKISLDTEIGDRALQQLAREVAVDVSSELGKDVIAEAISQGNVWYIKFKIGDQKGSGQRVISFAAGRRVIPVFRSGGSDPEVKASAQMYLTALKKRWTRIAISMIKVE